MLPSPLVRNKTNLILEDLLRFFFQTETAPTNFLFPFRRIITHEISHINTAVFFATIPFPSQTLLFSFDKTSDKTCGSDFINFHLLSIHCCCLCNQLRHLKFKWRHVIVTQRTNSPTVVNAPDSGPNSGSIKTYLKCKYQPVIGSQVHKKVTEKIIWR